MLGGYFWVLNNDYLISLGGMESLTSLGDALVIEDNLNLMNMNGLINVDSVGGDLRITRNDAISSLLALENISFIGGDLDIGFNPALTSLSGLDNLMIDSIQYMYIHDNLQLSECAIESVCDFLTDSIQNAFIYNNAVTCNDPDTVLALCGTQSVLDNLIGDSFSIWPNPVENRTTIEFELFEPAIVSIQILDLNGKVIEALMNIKQQQGLNRVEFDATQLLPGIYICILRSETGIVTRKLIKL